MYKRNICFVLGYTHHLRQIGKVNYLKLATGESDEDLEIVDIVPTGKTVQETYNSVTFCPGCKLPDDDMEDFLWYGCDVCPRWWHRHCLTTDYQLQADISTMCPDEAFRCPLCPLQKICAVCFVEGTENFAQCSICYTFYHYECIPEDLYLEFKLLHENNKDWFCTRCEIEK